MFATLLGDLPRPPMPADAAADALVAAVVEAQVAAGLEPVTDGGWWGGRPPLDARRATAALTTTDVKQVLTGPLSAGAPDVLAAAVALNRVVRELADAGCPLVEIHEPAIVGIGSDPTGWDRVARAHERLTEGIDGIHLSLAITGGSADASGSPILTGLPYASLAVDLIAGPDNWRLVRATPGTRGIVCGVVSPLAGSDDGPEILLWAAAYAASGDGRGPDRVGLATASSFAGLPWDVAMVKIERLGAAARLATLPAEQLRDLLDPRSFDSRSAGLGRAEPPGNRSARIP